MQRPRLASTAGLTCLTSTLLISTLPASAQDVATGGYLPPLPAKVYDLNLITDDALRYPHIPPLRTSADGRVGLDPTRPELRLLRPEALTKHPLLESGTPIVSAGTGISKGLLHASSSAVTVRESTLLDPLERRNPVSSGTTDTYYLDVIVLLERTHSDEVELWQTPLTVTVSAARSAEARISGVSLGTPRRGPVWSVAAGRHPSLTADGRLLVLTINKSELTWRDAQQRSHTGTYTVAYSYRTEVGDPAAWDQLYPISHAAYDPRLEQRYGFALRPLRDFENQRLNDGDRFPGTCAWIDRLGRNLFFTSLGSTLYVTDRKSKEIVVRYDTVLPDGSRQVPAAVQDVDSGVRSRGVAVAGQWTQGKLVLLDTQLDNIDFGLPTSSAGQRKVLLYEGSRRRIGAGHDANANRRPVGGVGHTAVLGSLENLFADVPVMQPRTPGETVWLVSNGKATVELCFDDLLDDATLINAPMNVLLSREGAGTPDEAVVVHDGFVNDGAALAGFTGQVRLQNAATSTTWKLPRSGVLQGKGRVEPVSLGGIEGKGLYLSGNTRLSFNLPAQAQPYSGCDWTFGLFLDPGVDDDGVKRSLFTLPSGAELRLVGTSRVTLHSANGAYETGWTLPAPLVLRPGTWRHVGLTCEQGGRFVTLYVDGFQLGERTLVGEFALSEGKLTLGISPTKAVPGIAGWVDDFKVLSRVPSLEGMANLARATLVGLSASAATELHELAEAFPNQSHKRIRHEHTAVAGGAGFDRYAPHARYSQRLGTSHLMQLPGGATPIHDQHVSFRGAPTFTPDTGAVPTTISGNRVAFADVDSDGDPDAVVNGHLLLNDGQGRFTHDRSSGLAYCRGVAFADYDRDGDLDAFLSGGNGPDSLLRNDTVAGGPPRFTDVTASAGIVDDGYPGEALAWGDVNGDGYPDLYLANFEDGSLGPATPDRLWLSRGGGVFYRHTGVETRLVGRGVTLVDFDRDGDVDIHVSNYRLQQNLLWVNHAGSLREEASSRGVAGVRHSGYYGHSIGSTWGDLDADGDLDLVTANLAHPWELDRSDATMVYLQQSGGVFGVDVREQVGILYEETHSHPTLFDADDDGDLDLHLTSTYGGRRSFLYRNTFEDSRPDPRRAPPAWSTAFSGQSSLARPQPGPRLWFHDVAKASGAHVTDGWGAATADVDGDGDLDLLVLHGKQPLLLRNQRPAGHGSVRLRLRGRRGDTWGAGATVTLSGGGAPTQVRQLMLGHGTGCQSEPILHFGVGPATGPFEVEVRWLGGQVSRHSVGRGLHTLSEPE